MDPLMFIAAALTVWRLSEAITDEEGPFSAFTWLRTHVTKPDWLSRGLWCLWCVSFWIGPIVAYIVTQTIRDAFLFGWAWSAVAILFNKVLDTLGHLGSRK